MQSEDIFPAGDTSKINVYILPERNFEAMIGRSKVIQFGRIFSISIPARVGLAVKDMNTFFCSNQHLKPGGGGLGLALSKFTHTFMCIRPTPIETEALDTFNSPRATVLQHHAAVIRAALKKIGRSENFAISLYSDPSWSMHCGLGSTSAAALGLYHGVNSALGEPLTDNEIRLLLATNYVEECEQKGEVKYGFETTMTATGAHGGGIYVLSEHLSDGLPVLARNVSPRALAEVRVFVLSPQPNWSQTKTEDESIVLIEAALDDITCQIKKNEAFDRIIAMLNSGDNFDVQQLSNEVDELQRLGSKRVEILKRPEGVDVLRIMDTIRENMFDNWKTSVIGMSSVGPSIMVMCNPTSNDSNFDYLHESISKIALASNFQVAFDTTIALDGGMKIDRSATPILVSVQGPPGAGKSTFCKQLVESYTSADNFIVRHISAGSLMREYIALNDDDIARSFRQTMASGVVKDSNHNTSKLVCQKIVQIMSETMTATATATTASTNPSVPSVVLLLDGFPRSLEQKRDLTKLFGVEFHGYVSIQCSDIEARHQRTRSRQHNFPKGQSPSPPNTDNRIDPDVAHRDEFDETDLILADVSSDSFSAPICVVDNSAHQNSGYLADNLMDSTHTFLRNLLIEAE